MSSYLIPPETEVLEYPDDSQKHLSVQWGTINYYPAFTTIRSHIGTMYLAIFYSVFQILLLLIFPIMYVGYPFVAFLYYFFPNDTTTFFFAPWFFQTELNLAVWKNVFGADFWLHSTLNYLDPGNVSWNLFWYFLWYPFWFIVDQLFYLLSVPAGVFLGWW